MPTVLGVSLSPFVRKVRVALAEKSVPYDLVPVFPGERRGVPENQPAREDSRAAATATRASPIRRSSTLYLEKKHPSPSLYPSDPYEYARALWFEEWADSALVNVIGPKIFFEKIVATAVLQPRAERGGPSRRRWRRTCRRCSSTSRPAHGRLSRRQPALDRRHRRLLDAREPVPRRLRHRHAEVPEARALRRAHPRAAVVQELHRRREGDDRRAERSRPWRQRTASRSSGSSARRTSTRRRAGRSTGRASRTCAVRCCPGRTCRVVLWLTGQTAVPVLQSRRRDDRRLDAHHRRARSAAPRAAALPRRPRRAPARARARGLLRRGDRPAHPARALPRRPAGPDVRGRVSCRTGIAPLAKTLYRRALPGGPRGHALRHGHHRRRRRAEPRAVRGGARPARARRSGRPGYLVGDAFSVADLTAAALLSPLTLPPGVSRTPRRRCRASVARVPGALREAPGVRWAREMYRRHRGTSRDRAAVVAR